MMLTVCFVAFLYFKDKESVDKTLEEAYKHILVENPTTNLGKGLLKTYSA